VAVQSLPGAGASDAAAGRCRWLSSLSAAFKTLPCTKVIWLKASGTKHWHLALGRRLPKGRYLVFALALGKSGLSADTFDRGAGDTRRVTIR